MKKTLAKVFNKETLNRTTVLTIIIVWAIAGAFYWYQVRPSKIRKACNQISLAAAKKKINSPDGAYRRPDYQFYYDQCLHRKGLE